MMKIFKVQFDGVATGCIYAVLIYVLGVSATGPVEDDLLLRAFFGFALGVCSKPALDGAQIDLNSATPPKYAQLYLGWAMGSMWGLAMILAFWPLMPLQFVIWVLGGAFFGFVMAKLQKPEPLEPERLALYNLQREIFAGWNPLWRIGPGVFLLVALTAIVFQSNGADDKSPHLMLGISAVLLSNNAPYPLAHRGLKVMQAIVAVATILAGYMSL